MRSEAHFRAQISLNESIYDAHSHIGSDLFFKREGNLDEYFILADMLKIVKANIMPPPSPKYFEENKLIESLFWESNGRKINYLKRIRSEKELKIVENPINPYAQANQQLKEKIDKYKKKEIILRYVPLIHPTLDTLDYLDELLMQKPAALKIHGIAAGIVPEQISKSFLKTIAKSNIPVIVHTDNTCDSSNTLFNYFRKHNTAYNWCNIFINNDIKAYITHGAYLCEKTFEIINKSEQFILGLGPVKLMELEKQHFIKGTRKGFVNYLYNIFKEVDINKIALDLDFPWNIEERSTYKEESISKFLVAGKLDKNDRKKVFFENSEQFFNH